MKRHWRIAARIACVLVVLAAQQLWAAEYHGLVRYDGVPVPGATVTLTQGSTELSTVTDSQGLYEFPKIAEGNWKITIELRGFAPLNGNVRISPTNAQGEWALQMLGLQDLLSMAQQEPAAAAPLKPREQEQPKESAKNEKPEEPLPQPPQANDDAERSADGLLINGSESNAATSRYSLSPAIGNHRPGTKALYNGSLGAYAENSIFDAKPYSLAGLVLPKDNYNRITMVVTFGGPIRIPPLFYHGPNFFLAYQWTRNGNASTGTGLVPTQAERNGDLSSLPNAQQIYDPATGAPFTGCGVTSSGSPGPPCSSEAQKLLAWYPLPNIAGNTRYNYERSLLNDTHEDALQSRLDKTVGHRDSLYGGFSFQNIRSSNESLFGFVDRTDTFGINTNVNWQHRFERQIFATFGYQLSRLRTQVLPYFAYATNVSNDAGITGNDQDPREWGPPTLTFSSGIATLTDANSEFNRNRTDRVSLQASTTRGRHTILAGGDVRWQEYNQLQQQNPRGSFTFTGAATSASGTASASGSDLADFLLGFPDASALAYGNADKYLRQRAYDAYVNDDWRVRPELTINAGVRWEYGAPMTELKGRLVNLDLTPDFAAAAPVLGSSPKGPLTGKAYPSSLVHGDLRGIEPRVALSWRPIPASTLVVRAGYGIYDDTSIYLAAAESMSQQAPLSTSLNVQRSANCPLTLADGFMNCAGTTPDNFAVDPNLRVGYAQVWQLSAQRDLPGALVVTATYLGTKGTHGTQEFLPNTYPVGATNPCPQCPVGFIYRTSGGNLEREAAQLQLRRRLRAGITATLDYTFAKSVDDDSQVGGQGHAVAGSVTASSSSAFSASPTAAPIVAQNWLDLRAERSPSSFDQRHLLNFVLQYTTGMGKGGRTLLSGWRGRAFKEWTVLAEVNAGSGLPETPVYISPVPGTGFANIMRPDRTGAPLYVTENGYFLNSQAYAAPEVGQWGNAGRNSIRGPMTFTMNAALARTLRVRTNDSFDIRIEANNLLNHATFTAWNTIWNPTTFGLPASVNPMRSVQLVGRFRF